MEPTKKILSPSPNVYSEQIVHAVRAPGKLKGQLFQDKIGLGIRLVNSYTQ